MEKPTVAACTDSLSTGRQTDLCSLLASQVRLEDELCIWRKTLTQKNKVESS